MPIAQYTGPFQSWFATVKGVMSYECGAGISPSMRARCLANTPPGLHSLARSGRTPWREKVGDSRDTVGDGREICTCCLTACNGRPFRVPRPCDLVYQASTCTSVRVKPKGAIMSFTQLQNIFDEIKQIHRQAAACCAESADSSDERLNLLADFFRQWEQRLESYVDSIEGGKQKEILDTWVQFAPTEGIDNALSSLRRTECHELGVFVKQCFELQNEIIARLSGIGKQPARAQRSSTAVGCGQIRAAGSEKVGISRIDGTRCVTTFGCLVNRALCLISCIINIAFKMPCTLLLTLRATPARGVTDMKTILYATDYSTPSQYALHFAVSLARDCRADLLIVHVSETECGPVGELFDEEPEPCLEEQRRLEAVVPDDTRVPFEHRLLCPPPSSENTHAADEIIKLAKQENVHAIVVGTHGRTGLSRLLVGSVAESVIRQAPCPVVIIRKPNP